MRPDQCSSSPRHRNGKAARQTARLQEALDSSDPIVREEANQKLEHRAKKRAEHSKAQKARKKEREARAQEAVETAPVPQAQAVRPSSRRPHTQPQWREPKTRMQEIVETPPVSRASLVQPRYQGPNVEPQMHVRTPNGSGVVWPAPPQRVRQHVPGFPTFNLGAPPSRGYQERRPFVPYEIPDYGIAPGVRLYFRSDKDWQPSGLVGNPREIQFGYDFRVKDHHLNAIIATSPQFRNGLESIQCGSSEIRISVTDAAVIRLTKACPNLQHVRFSCAHALTDAALEALFKNCRSLISASISGDDRSPGRITGSAFKVLNESVKTRGKEPPLRALYLHDQSLRGEVAKHLTRERKFVEVHEGTTIGDGYAAQMVAGMTGDYGEGTTWKNGRRVGGIWDELDAMDLFDAYDSSDYDCCSDEFPRDDTDQEDEENSEDEDSWESEEDTSYSSDCME